MLRSFILFAGLVLALGLAGCPQQSDEPVGDAEVTEEEVVIEEAPAEAPADTGSMEEAPADSGNTGSTDGSMPDDGTTNDTSGENSGY